MRVAIVCSAHGLGHVGRQLALAEALIAVGARVTMFTAAPVSVVHEYLPDVEVVPWTVDVGVVEVSSGVRDSADLLMRAAALLEDGAVDSLAHALTGFESAVVDIAPAALEACRRAGVRAVAVGNFDWPWIYSHFASVRPLVPVLRRWQSDGTVLALSPVAGPLSFAGIERFGILARSRPPVAVAERGVLVAFGGFGVADLDALLPRIDGVTWILPPLLPALERSDVVRPVRVPFPALIAGAAAVLTKPGYGIYGECALAGTPIVYVHREGFPETPAIEAALQERGDVKVGDAGVAAAVVERLRGRRPDPAPGDTAAALARRILRGGPADRNALG